MMISIESPEVLALIEEISRLTGEDVETVVQVAVREQLERLDAEEAEGQRRTWVQDAVVDRDNLLSDEDGLPK